MKMEEPTIRFNFNVLLCFRNFLLRLKFSNKLLFHLHAWSPASNERDPLNRLCYTSNANVEGENLFLCFHFLVNKCG